MWHCVHIHWVKIVQGQLVFAEDMLLPRRLHDGPRGPVRQLELHNGVVVEEMIIHSSRLLKERYSFCIIVYWPERIDLRGDGVTVYSYNTYFQHVSSSIVDH